MPATTDVLCAHCGHYMSRKRKCEHRRLITQPYITPPLTLPFRIRPVTDDDLDNDVPAASVNVAVESGQNGGSIDGDPDVGYVADDHGLPEVDVSEAAENALRAWWTSQMSETISQTIVQMRTLQMRTLHTNPFSHLPH
jgi:hypothetical protein